MTQRWRDDVRYGGSITWVTIPLRYSNPPLSGTPTPLSEGQYLDLAAVADVQQLEVRQLPASIGVMVRFRFLSDEDLEELLG